MKPISPVCPSRKLPEIFLGKDQPEYLPLPCYRDEEGTVTTRWKLTLGERFRVLFTGNLYLSVMTFMTPLQPLKLDTKCPLEMSPASARTRNTGSTSE